jgi:hypothetical protein
MAYINGKNIPFVYGSFGSDVSFGITSATVGQIVKLKVKTIDGNGKPTSWEVVNDENK